MIRRAVVLALMGLAAGCSSAGPSAGSQAGTTVLVLDTQRPGRAIPAGFLGLGIEYRALGNYAGPNPAAPDPILARLIANLSPGQSPVLRIGGDTTDWTWWPVPGMPQPPWVHYALTPDWLAVTRALTQRLGARLILGVNFEADSPTIASAEANALISGLGRPSIAALELGNEPELYHSFGWYRGPDGRPVTGRPADYDYNSFQREFGAIAVALPQGTIAGPTTGGPWWEPDWPQFLASQPRVGLATVHRYPLHACSKQSSPLYPTIDHLLSPLALSGLAADTRPLVRVAHRRGLPLRVDEMNPTPCPARALELRSFGGALWAADVLFEMAAVGVDGVNVQSSTGPTQDLFSIKHGPGGWRVAVWPEYYGLLLFARAAPPGSRLIPFSTPAPAPIHAWATEARDGTVRVVLINAGPGQRSLALGAGAGGRPASLERLLAPDVRAQEGVTLGGRSFGAWITTGQLAGTPSQLTIQPSQGRYAVKLPGHSAALLTIS
jgi:hypothetical protein